LGDARQARWRRRYRTLLMQSSGKVRRMSVESAARPDRERLGPAIAHRLLEAEGRPLLGPDPNPPSFGRSERRARWERPAWAGRRPSVSGSGAAEPDVRIFGEDWPRPEGRPRAIKTGKQTFEIGRASATLDQTFTWRRLVLGLVSVGKCNGRETSVPGDGRGRSGGGSVLRRGAHNCLWGEWIRQWTSAVGCANWA
jgi:hypothetical protein